VCLQSIVDWDHFKQRNLTYVCVCVCVRARARLLLGHNLDPIVEAKLIIIGRLSVGSIYTLQES